MTVASLITAALKRISVIEENETPSAETQSDALDRLNDLMDFWQGERLTIPYVSRTLWTIVSGQQDYSVGGARPTYVDHISYVDTSTNPDTEYPLHLFTDDEWAALPQKALMNTLPVGAYYQPTFPTATISLWMIPTSSTLQGALYAPNPIQQFTSTSQTIALPPGYQRFIRDSLAVELWPEWRQGEQIDPELVRSARDSKNVIKTVNLRPTELDLPYGDGIYDINSDLNYRA